MNFDYENKLEKQIDRALKDLPELTAPPALATKVMRAIDKRARVPWYRRSWQTWPMPLQGVSLALLMALFGALCFAGRELPHAPGFSAGAHTVSAWFSWLGALWNALVVLIGAISLLIKNLGIGFIAAGLFALALGYALCIGLGTVYVRLAWHQATPKPYDHARF